MFRQWLCCVSDATFSSPFCLSFSTIKVIKWPLSASVSCPYVRLSVSFLSLPLHLEKSIHLGFTKYLANIASIKLFKHVILVILQTDVLHASYCMERYEPLVVLTGKVWLLKVTLVIYGYTVVVLYYPAM